MVPQEKPIRLAVLQRVCPAYRTALFAKLSSAINIQALLFIGDDIPNSKVKNTDKLDGIKYQKLKTRFIKLGNRILPWHVGLIGALRKFDPDVILCEGESHFLGYLQAIFYRVFIKRRVALMHWCFISLPGWQSIGGEGFRSLVKGFCRQFFDAFVVYSLFSKDCLVKLGQPAGKIFVATNVGDTQHFIKLSEMTTESKVEARAKLDLPQKFTVLYLGTLDENKRPDVMLDLARECDRERFNFVLLGSGDLLCELREHATREKLSNVFLPGRIVEELPLYYRAADVLLIPGRGGIIMSEAMAFGLPVIVHEADGTEYDLVQNEVSGLLLASGNVHAFREALEFVANQPNLQDKMQVNSMQLVRKRFSTNNMVEQITFAAHYAKNTRLKSINDRAPNESNR